MAISITLMVYSSDCAENVIVFRGMLGIYQWVFDASTYT